jgi:hypothetical protein
MLKMLKTMQIYLKMYFFGFSMFFAIFEFFWKFIKTWVKNWVAREPMFYISCVHVFVCDKGKGQLYKREGKS